MKTEIKHNYLPRQDYFIDAVLPLTETRTAIFSSKYKSPSYLDVLQDGSVINSTDLSNIKEINSDNYYKCYFNLGDSFGFISRAEEVLIFNTSDPGLYKVHKISNPFPADSHDRKTTVERASTLLVDGKLICGLADYSMFGSPPRYISALEFNNYPSNEMQISWGALHQLPKQHFPETEFAKFNDERDWLNIRALTHKGGNIFVHTTGGSSTRLKSGNSFEFNLVGMFDTNYFWKKNFEIEKGFGTFSTEKKHFILNSNVRKNKVVFYTIENFEVDFEISLTAKQNIGHAKADGIKIDMFNDTLFVYSHRFLNLCKLIK